MFRRFVFTTARTTILTGLGLSFIAALASCGLERKAEREALGADGGGQAGAAARAQALGPGCTSFTYNSNDYLFCPDVRTWDSARTECQSAAMELVRINDSGENAFVRSHVPSVHKYWIGANDKLTEGTFVWSQGNVALTYTNWDAGQPNDFGTQDCVVLANSDGEWGDESCAESNDFGYVCEETAPPPPPPPPPTADTSCWSSPALQANAPWPMRGLCPLRRGAGKFVGSQVNTVNWTFPTGGDLRTGVAISADNTIYFGSDDNKLYALYPNGTQRWAYPTGGDVRSSPLLTSTGAVIFGSDDDWIYSLNATTGALNWKYNTTLDVKSSPAVAADGTIYIGSDTNKLYALSPTNGSVLWFYTTANDIHSSPAVMPDGTIVFGSDDDYVYALKPDLGLTDAQRLKWKTNVGADVNAIPAIGPAPDNFIYVRTQGGKVKKLNPTTGVVVATFNGPTDLDTDSSPAIGLDGDVYVGLAHDIYALRGSDLTQKWVKNTGGDVKSSPAIGADGTVYIGSDDKKLYALNPSNGAIVWTLPATGVGDWFRGSPAIAKGGAIIVGNENNKLYSVGSFACSANHPCARGSGPCTDDTQCGAGLGCGFGIAKLFGLPDDFGVCWDRGVCQTAVSPLCGTTGSYCGICMSRSCSATSALQSGAIWPMSGGCAQGRGTATGPLPESLDLLWRLSLGTAVVAEPVVDADGTAYVGADDHNFYAVRRNGTVAWFEATSDRIVASAALGSDGSVYFGSLDGTVRVREAATGTHVWSYTTGGAIKVAPVPFTQRLLVAGGSHLYSLNRTTGALQWDFDAGSPLTGVITVDDGEGPIYFDTEDHRLHGISIGGTGHWAALLPGAISAGPYMSPTNEPVVAVGSDTFKFDKDGTLVTSGAGRTGNTATISCLRADGDGYANFFAGSSFYSNYADQFARSSFVASNTFVGCPTHAPGDEAVLACTASHMSTISTMGAVMTTDEVVIEVPDLQGPGTITLTNAINNCSPATRDTPSPCGGMLAATDDGLELHGTCCDDGDCTPPGTCNILQKCECVSDCEPGMCGFDQCGHLCFPCGDGDECDADAECDSGLVCTPVSATSRVCFPPMCIEDCSGKACGDTTDGGCVEQCTSLCQALEPGCVTDADCPVDYACGEGVGESFGLPAGSNVCWPELCRFDESRSMNCGDTTSPCGTCSACEAHCTGRECGDDGCGGECGSCEGDDACTAGDLAGDCDTPNYGVSPLDEAPLHQGGGHFAGTGVDRGNEVGRVDGVPGVTPMGVATYSVPIEVPPGVEGLEPRLALTYASTAADGYLGRGWSLGGFGLSMITRCQRSYTIGDPDEPSTWRGPVAFDEHDAFCLDGERLMIVSGDYGADGSEYRTEVESFRKVVLRGGELDPYTGPESFEVKTRDGLTLYYGTTEDSQVLLEVGGPVRRGWALSRVVDRFGGELKVEYKNSQCKKAFDPDLPYCGTTELLPTAITYGPAGQNKLTFRYRTRENNEVTIDGFRSGSRWKNTRVLESIGTWSDTLLTRVYRLGYAEEGEEVDATEDARGFSLVKSISDCIPENATTAAESDDVPLLCKPPTVFRYHEPRPFDLGPLHTLSGAISEDGIQVLDFDGDGSDDLLMKVGNSLQVTKGSVSGAPGFSETTILNRAVYSPQFAEFTFCKPLGSIDFDGDNKDDLVVLCDREGTHDEIKGVSIWLSDGENLARVVQTNIEFAERLIDFNGDGVMEAVSFADNLEYDLRPDSACRAALSDGDPALPSNPADWPAPTAVCTLASRTLQAECTDDSKTRVIVDATGNRNLQQKCFNAGGLYRTIDANGDGLQDVLSWRVDRSRCDSSSGTATICLDGRVKLRLNTGKAGGDFLEAHEALEPGIWFNRYAFEDALVLDYDGDGREDLLVYNHTYTDGFPQSYGKATIWHPHRESLFAYGLRQGADVPEYEPPAGGGTPLPVFSLDHASGDFNGDGMEDVVFVHKGGPATPHDFRVIWNRNALSGAMRLARDGLGNTAEFSYDAPTFGRIPGADIFYGIGYEPGAACSWPLRCLKRPPLAVVTRLRARSGALPLEPLPELEPDEAYPESEVTISEGQTQPEEIRAFEYHRGLEYARQPKFLGFKEQIASSIDPSTGSAIRTTTTSYDVTHAGPGPVPFLRASRPIQVVTTGMVEGSELNENRSIDQTTTEDLDWQVKTSADGRPFVFLHVTTTTRASADGVSSAAVTVGTKTQEVDDFGNVTLVEITRPDGTEDRVETSYVAPDLSDWLIALPERVKRLSEVDNAPGDTFAQTRLKYSYDDGLLKHIEQEPDLLNTNIADDYYLDIELVRHPTTNRIKEAITRNSDGEIVRHVKIDYDDAGQAGDEGGAFVRKFSRWTGDTWLDVLQFHDPAHGGVLTQVDPNGLVSQFQYDGYGRLRGSSSPTGQTTEIHISPAQTGAPTAPIAVEPVYQVEVSSNNDQRSVVELDSAGRIRRTRTRGLGERSGSDYDLVDVYQEFAYDLRGRQTQRSRPHLAGDDTQGIVETHYDNFDRVVRVRGADTKETTLMYAPAGVLTGDFTGFATSDDQTVAASLDPVGGLSIGVRDLRGLQVATYERHGTQTSEDAPTGFVANRYVYGPFGMLQQATDPAGNTTVVEHDLLGRVESTVDPNAGERSYEHYPMGEIRRVFDSDGGLPTEYVYDALGRVTLRTQQSGFTEWEYDGPGAQHQRGRLVSSTSFSGVSGPVHNAYEYGENGLLESLTKTVDGKELTTALSYYGDGSLKDLTYPNAGTCPDPEVPCPNLMPFAVRNEYRAGYLTRVSDAATDEAFWSMDAFDQGLRPGVESLGNGAALFTDYEPLTGRVHSMSLGSTTIAGDPDSFVASKVLGYTYQDDGKVQTETVAYTGLAGLGSHSYAYHYDQLSRLDSVDLTTLAGTNTVEDFDYDPDGRITRAGRAPTSGGTPEYREYAYDQIPHGASSTGPGTTYVYDDNGNMSFREAPSIPGGSQTITYRTLAFDVPERITTSDPDGPEVLLDYDAEQARVFKRSSENPAQWVDTLYFGDLYQRSEPTDTTDPDPESVATHVYRIYAAGKPIAELTRQEVSGEVDTALDELKYIQADRRGSARTVLNEAGTVVAEVDYSAFGDTLFGAAGSVSGFTGHEDDADVGLVDMGGRVYDATLGQFLMPDPLTSAVFATQGLNRYSYVFNDPLNWTDPSGLGPCDGPCPQPPPPCDPNLFDCSRDDTGGGGGSGGGGGPQSSGGQQCGWSEAPGLPGTLVYVDCPTSSGPSGGGGGAVHERKSPEHHYRVAHDRGQPSVERSGALLGGADHSGGPTSDEWGLLVGGSVVGGGGAIAGGAALAAVASGPVLIGLAATGVVAAPFLYSYDGIIRWGSAFYAGELSDQEIMLGGMLFGSFASGLVSPPSALAATPEGTAASMGEAAIARANASQAAGREGGAAAELVVGDRVFTDVSTGGPRSLHPKVTEALNTVPVDRRPPWHGKCAEPGCISQALEAGVNPSGGTSTAVKIREPGDPAHATFTPACPSCSWVLDAFGINH